MDVINDTRDGFICDGKDIASEDVPDDFKMIVMGTDALGIDLEQFIRMNWW